MKTEKPKNKYRLKWEEIREGNTLNDFDSFWRVIAFFNAQGETELPFRTNTEFLEWEAKQ